MGCFSINHGWREALWVRKEQRKEKLSQETRLANIEAATGKKSNASALFFLHASQDGIII